MENKLALLVLFKLVSLIVITIFGISAFLTGTFYSFKFLFDIITNLELWKDSIIIIISLAITYLSVRIIDKLTS